MGTHRHNMVATEMFYASNPEHFYVKMAPSRDLECAEGPSSDIESMDVTYKNFVQSPGVQAGSFVGVVQSGYCPMNQPTGAWNYGGDVQWNSTSGWTISNLYGWNS